MVAERMKTWYPDGRQKEDYNFRNGKKHGPFQHWYERMGRLKNLEITGTESPTDHSQCGMTMGKSGWSKVIKTASVTDIPSFTMRMEGSESEPPIAKVNLFCSKTGRHSS